MVLYAYSKNTLSVFWAIRPFTFKWQHEKCELSFLGRGLVSPSPCVSNIREQKRK